MAITWSRPDLEATQAAYNHLFHSSLSLSKIKDAALECRLLASTGTFIPGRSILWKIFLLSRDQPLQPTAVAFTPNLYLSSNETSRNAYRDLLLEKMRAPDGSYDEGLHVPGLASSPPRHSSMSLNLNTNNPLSLDLQNPWKEWFAAMELRKTIAQDVERTFPDIAYFRDQDVQASLTNILYLWSSVHAEIGYRQGMHELAATIYAAVDYDSLEQGDVSDHILGQLCAREWVTADAWALFESLMHGMAKWYEWREPPPSSTPKSRLPSHVHLPLENGQFNAPSYVAPVVQSCNRMQSQYLKSVDPQLWGSLQSAGIEPQIYGIRWLRLLFTREFALQDSMVMWDGLLACDLDFNLAEWVCVAMLIRIRNQLIPSDYSEQLTCLLRYPGHATPDLDHATPHPSSLLLRQALALQLSPTPATGASLVVENRNFLHIPSDVPEPLPPPPRRKGRPAPTHQKVASDTASPSTETTGAKSGAFGTVRNTHLKQLSQQAQNMGLPDIARGLLDRGESFGINKTNFFSAVSELRRNLPDLAASAASLVVKTPTTPASFPLMDERTPEERPPWEPKTRREIEQEVDSTKALKRQLGDSVAWIVDVLLQSEDTGDANQEKIDKLRQRKQGALESLAYVRDVLQGNVTSLEDDRLWDEEELAKRRAPSVPAIIPVPTLPPVRPAVVAPQMAASASLPASSGVPPAPKRVSSSFTSSRFNAQTPTSPFMPRFSPPAPLPMSPPSSNTPVPDVSSPGAMPLARWAYTKSDFSAPSSTVLPPQPTRTALQRTQTPVTTTKVLPVPQAVLSKPSGDGLSSSKQGRQEVNHDPLGALR